MIGTILGQVTGQLDKRFILNALFPTLAFALAVMLAIAAGCDSGPLGPVEAWESDSVAAKVLTAIGAVALVLVAANLLNSKMQTVVGLFEGYDLWPDWLAALGRGHQLDRARKLVEATATQDNRSNERAKDSFELLFPSYPRILRRDDVAPTRLGNVLRSAEAYGPSRYGVDSVRVWSRLYPLLPDPITTSMVSARASMEFLLAVSFLAGIYAPLAALILIVLNGSLFWVFASLLGGTALALATYHAALQPAAIYGEMIRAAVDLHRLDLVKEMAMPMPANPAEERRVWNQIQRLFDRNTHDLNWHYVAPAEKK